MTTNTHYSRNKYNLLTLELGSWDNKPFVKNDQIISAAMIVVHVCAGPAAEICLLYALEKRSLCFGDDEEILLAAGMGGVSWDKIGVDKMACKEQNYNEKIQVGVFFLLQNCPSALLSQN